MSMKPIEVGCIAMIVGGITENLGRVGVVVEHDPSCPQGWVWAVDLGESTGHDIFGRRVVDSDPIWSSADKLRRIDGGEDESVTAEQDQEVTA